MKLKHGLHLAYCTNIHRGETWAQTFDTLNKYTLAVRERVCPGKPYAIGLRLGEQAARELSEPATLTAFRKWLDQHQCYVFTINGFPYGKFHGTRVKEQVYAPDWTTRERLDYTNRLFDLLAQMVPNGVEGSVSTVPVSFKDFIKDERQVREARANLWRCVEHIEKLTRQTGKKLHLGLEPEPLCYLETTGETVEFFEQLRADRPGDLRLEEHLGVNYDCCHLAVEFEDAQEALGRLRQHRIKISKLHLSNALKVHPNFETLQALRSFADDVYFHQVISRSTDGTVVRYKDLDVALNPRAALPPLVSDEWRIHFHIPLHSPATPLFGNTADHLQGVLTVLQANPKLCSHMEMETYTWEVMPPEMKKRNVVDQLVNEYEWTLKELGQRGIGLAN
ncbi:MAG: metabolite traffic protein EboE [Verrucomicrobiota bacterium]